MKPLDIMKLLALLCLLVGSSCVNTNYRFRYYVPESTIDAATLAPFQVPGKATVTGEAFHRTVGGDVKSGAGCVVVLHPDTPYARELVEKGHWNAYPIPDFVGPDASVSRKTLVGAASQFSFTDVPPGKWIIFAVVTWMVPSASQYEGMTITGGMAWAPVTVPETGTVQVVATSRDDPGYWKATPPEIKATKRDGSPTHYSDPDN